MKGYHAHASSTDAVDATWADHEIVHIFYVYIEESVEGFRWHIRAHDLSQSMEVGAPVFPTPEAARAAGLAALDRVCAQVRAHGYSR